MKKLLFYLLTIVLFFQTNFSFAQLAPGSTAPDWTLTDINGNTHHLYDILDDGKTVFLVFSATWCGPCWNFHNSGAFESIWDNYGPGGTDEARTFFIESDYGTPESCLYGNCGNTWGNWTAGINFPIINLTGSNGGSVVNDYQINYFPTVYAVCPTKKVYETGQASASVLETYIQSCNLQESSVLKTEEICYGDGNGMIDIEIQGGVSPVSYQWSTGATTQDISGISAGSYMITMTDGNNVSYETTIGLGGPTQALVLDDNNGSLDLDCYGDQTGFLHVTAYGGTLPYSVLWNDGSTDPLRDNLGAGTYAVTISDANGCEVNESYTITEPPELLLSLNKLDETCDQTNGFISASSVGGTGLHQYNIGQGFTSDPNFPNLTADLYTVTVIDDNNCETLEDIEVFNIPGPEAEAPSSLQISCEGTAMTIDASASNVPQGASINWSTSDGNIISGGNSLMPTVDASGTYTLNISDPASCDDETSVLVEPSPGQPVADAGTDKEINCSDPLATLGSANSSSGNNITYSWVDISGNEIGNTLFIDVQQAGVYTLIVTNTKTNCSVSSEVEVLNSGGSVTAKAEVEGVLDCNQSSVRINANGSSTGEHIIYTWLDNEGNVIGNDLELVVNEAGSYTLQVSDTLDDCTLEKTVVVEEMRTPPDFMIDGANELTCDQSSIELMGLVASPDSNYSAIWVNENGEELTRGLSLQTNSAGSYTLRITNLETGCVSEETFSVEENKELPAVSLAEPDQLSCLNDEIVLDGSSSSSGTQFTYVWMDNQGNVLQSGMDPTLIVSEEGMYTLEVINNENGCSNSSSIEVQKYDEVPSGEIIFNINTGTLNYTFTSDTEDFYEEVLWDFGDGTTANTLEANHIFDRIGEYNICLTLTNDCGQTKVCKRIFINYVGVDSVESPNYTVLEGESPEDPFIEGAQVSQREFFSGKEFELSYGPNPHSDNFQIQWKSYQGDKAELRVLDLNGKQVYTQKLETPTLGNHKIITSDWNPGMYILHWVGEKEQSTFKIIKQ